MIPQQIDSLPIRDLLSQWRETEMLYRSAPELRKVADGVHECIEELEQILIGDMSPLIKLIKEDTINE